MFQNLSKLVLIFGIVFLAGCTSQEEKWLNQIQSRVIDTERAIGNLKTHLSHGTIRNARILKQYANFVKRDKPELGEIIDTLSVEGTLDSLIFTNLQSRLIEAKGLVKTNPPKTESGAQNMWSELDSIIAAANINNFNMMLTDQINVIADMSDGKLGRVESMSKVASLAANKATDFGAGSQLIGNPNYGSWRTNNSGTSAWTWFAMYAVFSSMNRNPIYYDRWSRGRDYSYYGSVGRHHYSSPKQKTAQTTLNKKHTDKFAKQGKRFQSPYAKKSVTTAKVSQLRQNTTRASSSQARASKFSRGSASSRSASTRTSRSSSRGK